MSEVFKVKRYDCMYSDQVMKKNKTWQDGFIRHHHYNSKVLLLGEDGAVLAEAFHRPPAGHRRYRLSDSFLLDGEVRFDGFVAEVGALVWEGETDLKDIKKATQEARSKASEVAHSWAAEESGQGNVATAGPSSTRSNGHDPASDMKKVYKGWDVPAPKAYAGGKQKAPIKSVQTHRIASPSSIAPARNFTPRPQPTAAARPSKHPTVAALGTPARDSPHPPLHSQLTNLVGTPSRGAVSPFKAPRPRRTTTGANEQ